MAHERDCLHIEVKFVAVQLYTLVSAPLQELVETVVMFLCSASVDKYVIGYAYNAGEALQRIQ